MSHFSNQNPLAGLVGGAEVLCEDGPVIAVNKQCGQIVQGAPPGTESLADLVRGYLKAKYDKPGNVYLGIPHRLDRPVSGVVIFSRNSKCAARLSEQFTQRKVRKTYLALLERPPRPRQGTLEDWIWRRPRAKGVEIKQAGFPEAKLARLHYKTLWSGRGRALVEIHLETGRMHQIRVQFGSRGYPILGDHPYGAAHAFGNLGPERAIALHARRLCLLHPIRYDELSITAPLPRLWHAPELAIPGRFLE